MKNQPQSLRRAVVRAFQASDHDRLAEAVVNNALVRSLVYDLARFHEHSESRPPSKSTLGHLLGQIVRKFQDSEDPVVARLYDAGNDAQFMFALGELIRDVARASFQLTASTATTSATQRTARVCFALGDDEDVLFIKLSTSHLVLR